MATRNSTRPSGMSVADVIRWHFERATRTPSGCWLARCGTNNKGYPQVGMNGKTVYLTRLVLEHKLGRSLRPGSGTTREVVRHKCDVPLCINPEHLEPGTPKQNTGDMMRRGRNDSGEELQSSPNVMYAKSGGDTQKAV